MSNIRTIGQVAYHRPLAHLGMEELAARQRVILPSGGVLFARNADGEAKTAARQLVLDLVQSLPAPERLWPKRLTMLTMPGLQWRFERKLLGMMEPGWMRRDAPDSIYFTACENDRAIFYASVPEMPGLDTPRSELKQIKRYPFAEMGVKTRYASYFFANIDDLMAADRWEDGWDVVWLDYTGPLTVERLKLIRQFYRRYVRSVLVVTALKTRFRQATAAAIRRAGGYWHWLRRHLDGEILHELDYFDTSAMAQFAVRKKQGDPAMFEMHEQEAPTAFASAFAARGITPALVEFERAVALAGNNGASFGELMGVMADYARRTGVKNFTYDFEEGQVGPADKAKPSVPSSNPAEGHEMNADEAANVSPSAGMESAGRPIDADEASRRVPADGEAEDHAQGADEANSPLSSAAPSAEYISAAVAARTRIAREVSIFDRFKLMDGRPIGDVRPSELPRLAREGRMQAHLAEALMSLGQFPNDAELRILISAKRLETLIDQAKRDAFWHEH